VAGQLPQRLPRHRDVVDRGVGSGVARPQQHRQRLTSAGRPVVGERPQRMEPKPRLKVGAACSFCRGVSNDRLWHRNGGALGVSRCNGPIEGANTKVKFLERQMYGRAGFPLLRQRILLA
jgi:hypothetical protein